MKTLPLVRLIHLHADRKAIRIADIANIHVTGKERTFLLALSTAANFYLPGERVRELLGNYWELIRVAEVLNERFAGLPLRIVIGEKSTA